MSDTKLEIEVKFRFDDHAEILKRLESIGARKVDEGLEKNILFDRDGEIVKAGKLLRLRLYDGKASLTFKKRGPPSERFIVREEVILELDDFGTGKMLLEALGFRPFRTYEKKRQTWEHDGVGILVDTMPHLGKFIEIEGSKQKIIGTASKLGLDMKDAISKDYGQLFEEFRNSTGLSTNDMLFSEEGK
jgi:predicted adenylyl cyclase CyaB